MTVENQNNELTEEEEGEVDLEAELVSALSELRKTRRECKHLKEETKNLEDELLKSNKLIEITEIVIIDLKIRLEEARVTEEAINKLLTKKDKEHESLKSEIVLLRNKQQENNMNGSSKILNQIISNQRSTNDKTGIGYKAETYNPSTSNFFEETRK